MAQDYQTVPDCSVLWELFDYKPLTGQLVRKQAGSTRPDRAGKPAGSLNKSLGYIIVNIKGRNYYAHRLIWRWVTGDDPQKLQVDHKNMDKADNRWGNLRLATKAQNMRNRLCTGVTLTSWGWKAQITVDYKNIYLGYYSTKEEAEIAYKKAAVELHGEFAKV
jgi:hypothetical protein